MKRFLAILLMFVVVVAGTFAAETHNVNIKANVKGVTPVFGLQMTSPDHADYITNTAALENEDYTTSYGKGTSYGHTENAQAFDVNFDLNEDGSVTFQALLLNRAKENENYTLEFGGGVFDVTRAGVSGTHSPASITTSAGTSLAGLSISLGSNASTGTTTNKQINLTFDGKTVDTGNTGKYVLGQAVYA